MAVRWTEDAIIAALKRWDDEVGEAPSTAHWDAARQPHPHWIRHRDRFPSASTVVRVCGSWLAGLHAAGLTPRPAGRAGQLTPRQAARREKARRSAQVSQLRKRTKAAERELQRMERAA